MFHLNLGEEGVRRGPLIILPNSKDVQTSMSWAGKNDENKVLFVSTSAYPPRLNVGIRVEKCQRTMKRAGELVVLRIIRIGTSSQC